MTNWRFSVQILFVAFVWAVLLPTSGVNAQDKTPIDWEARRVSFDRSLGENVRRLIDNVVFVHEETRMVCDSAYLYVDDNSLRAFGNVFIEVSDTVHIYGDELFYDGNARTAELRYNVRMIDPQMTLETDYLEYDMNLNTATYVRGGRIKDGENVLSSVWGFYFADRKEFFFRDGVRLDNPDYVMLSDTLMYHTVTEIAHFFGPTQILSDENTILCRNGWYDTMNDVASFGGDTFFSNSEQTLTGDSVYYDRRAGYGKAINNVVLRDSVEQIVITGHFAEHFEKEGRSVVTQEAVLMQVADGDSLYLHADTLETRYDEEVEMRQFLAYHRVRFFRHDLQGLSDSVAYNMNDSTISLFYNPVLWTDAYQLTASEINVFLSDDAIDRILLTDAAFIVSQEGTLGFNQMKGREMTGYFVENKLSRVDVDGNGETIFYVLEDDGSLLGINQAMSSYISIFFENSELLGLQFVRQVEASLHPPEEMPEEDRLLQNFRWMDERRPRDKTDIFVWR